MMDNICLYSGSLRFHNDVFMFISYLCMLISYKCSYHCSYMLVTGSSYVYIIVFLNGGIIFYVYICWFLYVGLFLFHF